MVNDKGIYNLTDIFQWRHNQPSWSVYQIKRNQGKKAEEGQESLLIKLINCENQRKKYDWEKNVKTWRKSWYWVKLTCIQIKNKAELWRE